MPDPDSPTPVVGSALVVVAALAAVVLAAVWLHGPNAPRRDRSATVVVRERELPAGPPTASLRAAAPSNDATPPTKLAASAPPPEDFAGTAASPNATLEDMISRVMPAVVLVETPTGRGSGFFVARDTLLTNMHVVGANVSVTIQRMNGLQDTARVAALASDVDIAVLKVSSPDPNQAVIAMGSAGSVRVGQEVIAIGSPLGTLQNTVTRGIVSAIRRSGSAMLVQTDAAVNPGNSGGPLLDRAGAAVGITTMGYTNSQGLNFAVAIDHARSLLEGRATAAPPADPTSATVLGLSPAVSSETDRTRDDGSRLYEQTLADLARRADALDADWPRFRASCYTSRIAGTFDRQWLAVLDSRAMMDPVAPACGTWLDTIKQQAAGVRDGVMQAEEAARKAGVFPGVRRDALQKYHLQVQ